eukprot:2309186-Prymnesium_polylepis.2
MIEANPEHATALAKAKRKNRPYVIAVLGNDTKQTSMWFGAAHTGNSLFPEPGGQYHPRTVTLRTLDNVAGGHPSQLLKLDIQGAELLVLAGATRTLRSVEVLMIELSLVDYNPGSPQFAEVVAELTRLGFLLRTSRSFTIRMDALGVEETLITGAPCCRSTASVFDKSRPCDIERTERGKF